MTSDFDTTVAGLTLAQLAAAYEDTKKRGQAVGINNKPTRDALEYRNIAALLRLEMLRRLSDDKQD